MSSKISSHFGVYVRVRPTNDREFDDKTILECVDEHVINFDPPEPGERGRDARDAPDTPVLGPRLRRRAGANPELRIPSSRRARDLTIAFDRVFPPSTDQAEVFEHTTRPLVSQVFEGYPATIFCYGATGAGKTYTMMGTKDNPGVMVRTLDLIFSMMEDRAVKTGTTSEVTIRYLEIYNEKIHDLLVERQVDSNGRELPPRQLALRDDQKRGIVVAGLSEHKPISSEEVLDLIEIGNCRRSQAPTDINFESSRSHAILQVEIQTRSNSSGDSSAVSVGKMMLIDLAGSERAADTRNKGTRFIEGANINKSLLALGNCIHALTRTTGASKFVPYRDSKLTRILRDSLGGNCKSVMIANVSPSIIAYDDTHNTLKYASRAKEIKTRVSRNVSQIDHHITEYRRIISDLKGQVASLQAQVDAISELRNANNEYCCPHCKASICTSTSSSISLSHNHTTATDARQTSLQNSISKISIPSTLSLISSSSSSSSSSTPPPPSKPASHVSFANKGGSSSASSSKPLRNTNRSTILRQAAIRSAMKSQSRSSSSSSSSSSRSRPRSILRSTASPSSSLSSSPSSSSLNSSSKLGNNRKVLGTRSTALSLANKPQSSRLAKKTIASHSSSSPKGVGARISPTSRTTRRAAVAAVAAATNTSSDVDSLDSASASSSSLIQSTPPLSSSSSKQRSQRPRPSMVSDIDSISALLARLAPSEDEGNEVGSSSTDNNNNNHNLGTNLALEGVAG